MTIGFCKASTIATFIRAMISGGVFAGASKPHQASASKPAKPGAVAYGTIGAGSLAHLAMSQIGNALDVTMTHVPYKGGGPLVTDAIGGHVPVAIASTALFSPHVKAGKLTALAVTSAKRAAQLPDTPTVSELRIAGFDAEAGWGLLAESGLKEGRSGRASR